MATLAKLCPQGNEQGNSSVPDMLIVHGPRAQSELPWSMETERELEDCGFRMRRIGDDVHAVAGVLVDGGAA